MFGCRSQQIAKFLEDSSFFILTSCKTYLKDSLVNYRHKTRGERDESFSGNQNFQWEINKMNASVVIKEYIREELMNGSNGELDESENLLAAGVIDSLGILRLVSFVEEKFGIEVPDEDVTIDNFQSVKAMSDYVASQS
jgi:acyl carrier protein